LLKPIKSLTPKTHQLLEPLKPEIVSTKTIVAPKRMEVRQEPAQLMKEDPTQSISA